MSGPGAPARGRTEVADRVVAKIALQAARETPGAQATPGWRSGLGGRAGSRAVVNGRDVLVTLDVTVDWPAPVREVAGRVRARVVDRLDALADLHARQVDVSVTALRLAPGPAGRVQ